MEIMDPAELPRLLTTDEVARILCVRRNTLEKWRSCGPVELPFVKCGKSVGYRIADVMEFMEKNRKTSSRKVN